MKTHWKFILSIGAVLLTAGGVYEVVFGAVYQGTYITGIEFTCGPGCFSSSSNDILVTFQNYPLWNPPSFGNVNYSSTSSCPIIEATYTPQSPPPSCIYPPAGMSTDYAKNYGGALLIVLGAILGVAVVMGRERNLGPFS